MEDLDFSVPTTEVKKKDKGSSLFVILLIIQLGLICWLCFKPQAAPMVSASKGNADQVKKLAMKMEKQELNDVAAQMWQEYLNAAEITAEEKAGIWYRIGKLHQNAHKYEEALAAYYTSESTAELDSVKKDIAIKVQECLESLGKITAMRSELKSRVGVNPTESEVLAEIGPSKITNEDLTKYIEKAIDRQLEQMASYLPPEEKVKQKEQMLNMYTQPQSKYQMLFTMVHEDLLYRKAREDKLTDNEEVKDMLQDMTRSTLAGIMMQKVLKDRIYITETDVKNHYEANKAKYTTPEQVKIAHIAVEDEKKANDLLTSIDNGTSFEELAKGLSTDSATAAEGGVIKQPLNLANLIIPGFGAVTGNLEILKNAKAGNVVKAVFKTDKAIHVIKVISKTPAKLKSFEEVSRQVAADLNRIKQQEVQKGLFVELKDKYNVVIHESSFRQSGKDAQ